MNIKQLLDEGLLLSEAMERYYGDGMFLQRETLFIEAHSGEEAFESAVRCFVMGEIPEEYIGNAEFEQVLFNVQSFSSLIRTMMHDQKYEPSTIAREAAIEAFIGKVIQ